jgi:DNA-binding NarL/FixJ family response regulator
MGRNVSNRTKSILKYTAQGMPVKEVAKRLKVSPQVCVQHIVPCKEACRSPSQAHPD